MGPKEKKIRLYKSEIERVLNSWAFIPETQEWNIKLAETLAWLNNFKPSEIEYAIKIIENIQYFDDNRIRSIVSKLSGKISSILGDEIEKSLFFPLGTSSASSGAMFLYQYRKELKLSEANFKQDSFENYLNSNVSIVFFDDIIGSGNQATKFFNNYLNNKIVKCYYFSLFGLEKGISYIEKNAKFKMVIVGEEITDEEMAFTDNSEVFNKEEKEIIKPICEKYGKLLYKDYPLGYDDTQALIVFPHNTPNNTLPIIWASNDNEASIVEKQWSPLWNRKKLINSNTKISKKNTLILDVLFIEITELFDKMDKYFHHRNNISIKIKYEQGADFHSYTIKSFNNMIYLKIARNVFFNLDGSILIWLYKNRSITEEASFNAVVKQNFTTRELEVFNFGLFFNRREIEINYKSAQDFFKDVLNTITILIK